MWFTDVANVANPEREELDRFITGVENFLAFVIENLSEFSFLWEDAPELRELAMETFHKDVREGVFHLRQEIPRIPEKQLVFHGLIHRPMRFKLKVLDSIGQKWETVRGQFSVRDWLKKIIEAIDAILDSLIHAAGGAGGIIKEFKDALSALA
ncbi:MAG TPA: hypothetical protein VFG19_06740 [Geobacteraceae bacterium]|nr:hypothetical protein [Geobacteraceae bacterium]